MGIPFTSATSIKGLSWFGVELIFKLPESSKSNQAHPEPNREVAAAANCSLNLSREPNVLLIIVNNFSDGWLGLSDRLSQKKLWFQAPPALFLAFGEYLDMFARSCSSEASLMFSARMASLTALI